MKSHAFYFALLSACIIFNFVEDRMHLGIENIYLFCSALSFHYLFQPAVEEDRLHLGIESKKNDFLLCSPLGLHYLCVENEICLNDLHRRPSRLVRP